MEASETIPSRARALAIGLAALACLGACAGDGAAAPCPSGGLMAEGARLASWPAPIAPGLEGPRALSETPERVVVDPDPSTRGAHALLELARDARCAVTLEPLAAWPTEPASPSAEIGDRDRDPTRAALLVTGADPAASDEAATWDGAFATLGLHGLWLASPARATVEEALGSLCDSLLPEGILVVVLAGPGDPSGGLLLAAGDRAAAEVMPYVRLDAIITQKCAHAGFVVWVADASYLPATVPRSVGPPMLVLAASDEGARDAARAASHGPGLLGQALADLVPRELGALCVPAGGRPEASEIAAAFGEVARGPTLRAALLERRWSAFGVPALARLEAEGVVAPLALAQLEAALMGAIPSTVARSRGAAPAGDRCLSDADCGACALGTCERAACDSGYCRPEPAEGAPCDDGDACTRADTCHGGECGGTPVACDDDNPCTDEACEPGRGCVATPAPERPCDDGDVCTREDACDASGACAGRGVLCDDGDPCTVDTCSVEGDTAGRCVFEPESGLACDDGDACTLADQCRDGICGGTRRACGDGNDCTVDRCDPETGQCRFDPAPDLVDCDDGDPCTTLDRCRAGRCVGLAATCDDALACTFDRCLGGACEHLPAPGHCLSPAGTSCVAVGEHPVEAPCLVCAATDALVADAALEGAPCDDDGIACTEDVCADGVCRHLDDALSCHDADGRCVAEGEPLTPCLLCRGGGVVTALPVETPCGGAVGCGEGHCDGLGSCVCEP